MANRFSIKVLCSAIQSKLQEIKHKLTARKNISAVGYLTTAEMIDADVAKDKYNGSPVLYIGETNNKFINGHMYVATSTDGWIDLTPSLDNNLVRVVKDETTYNEILDIVNSGKVPYIINTYSTPYGVTNKVFFYSDLPTQDSSRKSLYFMSMDGDKYQVDNLNNTWTYIEHLKFQESQYRKEEYSTGDSFEDKESYPSINYMNDFAKLKCSYINVLVRSSSNITRYNIYDSTIDSSDDTLTINGIRYAMLSKKFEKVENIATYKLLKYTSETKLSSLLYLDENGNITPVTLGAGLSINDNVISASGSSSNGSACVIWTLEKPVTAGYDLWGGDGLTADMLSGPDIRGTTTGLHLPSLTLDELGRIYVDGEAGRRWVIQATVFLDGRLTADANKLVQWGRDSRVQLLGAATRSFVVGRGDLLDGNGISFSDGFASASGKLIIEFVCQVES